MTKTFYYFSFSKVTVLLTLSFWSTYYRLRKTRTGPNPSWQGVREKACFGQQDPSQSIRYRHWQELPDTGQCSEDSVRKGCFFYPTKAVQGHRQLLSYLETPSWQASWDRIILPLPHSAFARGSQSCHACKTLEDSPHTVQMSCYTANWAGSAQTVINGENSLMRKPYTPKPVDYE